MPLKLGWPKVVLAVESPEVPGKPKGKVGLLPKPLSPLTLLVFFNVCAVALLPGAKENLGPELPSVVADKPTTVLFSVPCIDSGLKEKLGALAVGFEESDAVVPGAVFVVVGFFWNLKSNFPGPLGGVEDRVVPEED